MKPSEKNQSEDLAQRLRSLYITYECESELPNHEDLAAKLNDVQPEVRIAVQIELNCGYVDPISYEKAEIAIDEAAEDEEIFQNLIEGMLEEIPDAEKKYLLEYLMGKTTEVTQKELAVKEFLELYNNDAREAFKGFKANLKYFIKI